MRWGGRPSRSPLCPRKRPSATPVQHVKMGQDATFVVIPLSFESDASDAFRSSVRARRSLTGYGFGDGDAGHAGERH